MGDVAVLDVGDGLVNEDERLWKRVEVAVASFTGAFDRQGITVGAEPVRDDDGTANNGFEKAAEDVKERPFNLRSDRRAIPLFDFRFFEIDSHGDIQILFELQAKIVVRLLTDSDG